MTKKSKLLILIIAAVVVCLFVLLIGLGFAGYYVCIGRPMQIDKAIIAAALKEKYGEEFKVVSLKSSGGGGGSLTPAPNWTGYAFCYPISDPEIWVEVWVTIPTKRSMDNQATIYHDDYITSLLKRDLQNDLNTELGKYFDLFVAEPVKYHSMGIFYDNGIHSAADATPENISAAMQKEREDSKAAEDTWFGSWYVPDKDVSVDIVLPESALKSEDKIRAAVLETAKHFEPLKIYFSCWFTDEETVTECAKIVQKRDRNYLAVFGKVTNYPNEPMESGYSYTPDKGLEYYPVSKYK